MAGRRTPLYPNHLSAGGRMVEFAGWDMPLQYTSVKDEQQAVRTAAGIFDVSHMGRFEVRGPRAQEVLQQAVTNDVGRLRPRTALYTLMCRPDGGILDDLIVYRREDGWWVVVNAANRERDLAWLQERAGSDVEVVDRTDEVALLALQGPRAGDLMAAAGGDPADIPYFGLDAVKLAGIEAVASRTGYTGEDGFGLFVPSADAWRCWDALVGAGARPCGLAARDVCRLEAGLRLYGSDMDEGTNPYEAGLGWTVKLDKGDFVGREALRDARAAGPRRKLAGLACADRTIARHGARVRRDGTDVGVVTSGTYSFWMRRGIAMASLETAATEVGGQVAVEARGGEGRAEVVGLPFYRGSARSAPRAQA